MSAKSSSLLSSFRSSSSYNHETETIFALPRMQLDFKSIHVQDPEEPSLTGAIVLRVIYVLISVGFRKYCVTFLSIAKEITKNGIFM